VAVRVEKGETMDDMTPTDDLRALLDERGIEEETE
jgi:hypothetical protein